MITKTFTPYSGVKPFVIMKDRTLVRMLLATSADAEQVTGGVAHHEQAAAGPGGCGSAVVAPRLVQLSFRPVEVVNPEVQMNLHRDHEAAGQVGG